MKKTWKIIPENEGIPYSRFWRGGTLRLMKRSEWDNQHAKYEFV